MRTISYPLPALRLTRPQCEAIMAPILQYCLPALGICRNFPRKLVFSTFDYYGINVKHLFVIQEIARVHDIIYHTFNDTLSGRLYQASLELFFIKLGIQPTTLRLQHYAIIDQLITPSLVKSTMLFLLQHNISLKHPARFLANRDGDQLIMEALLELDISPQDLIA